MTTLASYGELLRCMSRKTIYSFFSMRETVSHLTPFYILIIPTERGRIKISDWWLCSLPFLLVCAFEVSLLCFWPCFKSSDLCLFLWTRPVSFYQDLLQWICVYVLSRSVMSDSTTLWTVAFQAPLSMVSSRQEYWSK